MDRHAPLVDKMRVGSCCTHHGSSEEPTAIDSDGPGKHTQWPHYERLGRPWQSHTPDARRLARHDHQQSSAPRKRRCSPERRSSFHSDHLWLFRPASSHNLCASATTTSSTSGAKNPVSKIKPRVS